MLEQWRKKTVPPRTPFKVVKVPYSAMFYIIAVQFKRFSGKYRIDSRCLKLSAHMLFQALALCN